MEFRVLGQLEVSDGGRAVALGGPKQRALLAILLLHRGRVVSTDCLMDALWGEEPPPTASKALQVYVSRLRRSLGSDRLIRRAYGYLLRLRDGELDLDRARLLIREGRDALTAGDPERGAAALREALALWSAPALADFTYDSFAQGEIARLEALRLGALEDRINADLALGRHVELVPELEALVREHPLRERLRGQLMLALYRCGCQAEALDVYDCGRRALADELGVAPGAEIRALHDAIVRHGPSLMPLCRQAPSHPGGALIGREHELGELVSGLSEALAGHAQLFLVSGEPGIGKSRLADELARHANQRGANVLLGRCWEAEGAPAYWPWQQALREYLGDCATDSLRCQIGAGAPESAQIVPEVGDLFPDLPALPAGDPEGARFRLFEATATFLRNASRPQPLVLVLDDVHAADTPSLLLLRFVAAELAEEHVLILCAYRDVDPMLADPLSSTLAELCRLPMTRRLALQGLSRDDVARLIALTAGAAPSPSLVAAVHNETEGNPLFVKEMARLLASEERFDETNGDIGFRLRIPEGVKEVIGRRLRHLPRGCMRVLTLASVLGREFELEALQRLADVPGDELLDALDHGFAAHVLTEVPATPGRLRFSHALIRDVLYDRLTPARRVRLHRRAGEALEKRYAQHLDAHLAEIAHHLFEAAPGGDADKAVDYARRAGERAVESLAFEEAVRLYKMALRVLEQKEHTDELARCELLLALGDAQGRAGDGLEAKETFLDAAGMAERLCAAEHLGRAALGYGGRFVWARAGTDRHLIPLLQRALSALAEGDGPLRVRLLARLAGAMRDQRERKPRASLSREALDMARRIGDPATLAYALDGRLAALLWPENPEERIELASELVRIAEEAGDRERGVHGRWYRMFALFELGEVEAATAELERVDALARQLRQLPQLWLVAASRATLALSEGRFGDAENLIPRALALGERAQTSDAVLSHRLQVFTLRLQRGGLEDVEATVRQSVEEYPARPMFRCMLARLQAELGRLGEARRGLRELAPDDFAALPRTNEWLFSMAFLAEVAELLGDAACAQVMYRLLLPFAAHVGVSHDYMSTGSVSRPLGLLARTLSLWDEAAAHFEAALEINERTGARPWLAHTQYDYGRMLLARDRPANGASAGQLLTLALRSYRRLGMEPWAQKASTAREALPATPAR